MQVTFKGDPIEVKGIQPSVGDKAPNATVTNNKGDKVELEDVIKGNVTILSVVPDVLTRTCELQTKNFAKKTADKGYKYITLGRNTVEEFNEWNKENNLNVDTYTDADGEFGKAYGLNIELGGDTRTTRSVFVVDKDGVIQYKQIVDEVADEPDYDSALEAADKL
ncbi:redoxin domain-containing protein [Aerococcaceae bacterium INB8]|uniref:Redoxin domain-containing protein n=1 Tax=Ruoffia halotolerans TaxID=2748684 RepID=A0A839A8N0_9LACT|nr:redoxin family protein [Ruoffia halotolerans]MBA5730164.1 redoxin domain-containing protein [Ruoffia halotolerans]